MKSIDSRRRRLLMGASVSAALSAIGSRTESAQAAGIPAKARMPVIFVGHGSPMNAVRQNAFTRHLQQWGEAVPRPKAILSVSAHWLTPGVTAVDVQEHPRTIHDFGGFPPELHAMQYPASGSPSFAQETAVHVKQAKVIGTTDWGLDHGTWTVLHHMFPRADVPVFQLSIDYDKPGAFHLAVGRELAGLRDQGVLVLGSGNIVHNLRATDRGVPDGISASRPWAAAFDAAVVKALAGRDDKALANYAALDTSAAQAVPTPDHYFPLLYALGAADGSESARSVFEGFQAGTLSMRCLQFG
jgi:4,5-DOPA dioxygenase extradiol